MLVIEKCVVCHACMASYTHTHTHTVAVRKYYTKMYGHSRNHVHISKNDIYV